jgi:hypothetical protein
MIGKTAFDSPHFKFASTPQTRPRDLATFEGGMNESEWMCFIANS